MPETADTGTSSVVSVIITNLVLKGWLHSIGQARRCKVLRKIKEELQDLGLSRKLIRRGLIQLTKKPRVVLVRLSPGEQYGPKASLGDDEQGSCEGCEKKPEDPPRVENDEGMQPQVTSENVKTDDSTCSKKERLSIRVSIKTSAGLFGRSRGPGAMNNPSGVLHAFDKALEQFDKLMYVRKNERDASSSKRTSGTVSPGTARDSRHKNRINSLNKMSRKNAVCPAKIETETSETPKSAHKKIDSHATRAPEKEKKVRIKLNLKSYYSRKRAEHAAPEASKTPEAGAARSGGDTNTAADHAKSEVDKELHDGKRCVDGKAECTEAEDKVSRPESNLSAGNEVARVEENVCKRRLQDAAGAVQRKKICSTFDENKESNKKKRKKLRGKFRIYFGDCMTVSEDEQEQRIIEKRFKRRRTKDSVDSCDSGVCITQTRTLASIKATQADARIDKSDSAACKKNDDASASTSHDVTVHRSVETTGGDGKDASKNATSAIKPDNDKIGNESPSDGKAKETEELSQDQLTNPSDNTIEQNAIASNDIAQTIEEAQASVLVPKTSSRSETEMQLELQAKTDDSQAEVELKPDAQKQAEQPEVQLGSEQGPSSILSSESESLCSLKIVDDSGSESGVRTEAEIPKIMDIDTTCDTPKLYGSNTDDSQDPSQENTIDTDLVDLLNMDIVEYCQITSIGNVLSIQETPEKRERQNTDMDKDIDENRNVKVPSKIEISNTQAAIEVDVAGPIEENNNVPGKDVQLLLDAKNDAEVPIINIDPPGNVDEPVTQSPAPDIVAEKKNDQHSKPPQGRLRVLTSAELGSRWCPTPVNTNIPTVAQTTVEVVLKVPATYVAPMTMSSTTVTPQMVPLTTVPVSTVPTFASAKASSADSEVGETVNITFVKIYNLVQSARISLSISKLDYNKLLLAEFEKLRNILITDNYVALIEGALCVLNMKLLASRPLYLSELFQYCPSLKSLHARTCEEQQRWNQCAMASQNAYHSQSLSSYASAVTVQTKLQNLLFISHVKSQNSMKAPPKPTLSNSKEKPALQAQKTVFQCNRPNPPAAANGAYLHQLLSGGRAFVQNTSSNTCAPKQKATSNVYAAQTFPAQNATVPSSAAGSLGTRPLPISVANSLQTCMNQQCVQQRVFVPHGNAYYNVNVSNYQMQQTMRPAQVNVQNPGVPQAGHRYHAQGSVARLPISNVPNQIHVQCRPQHVPLTYIPQPVQAMFSTNVPCSVPKNVQQPEPQHKVTIPRAPTNKALQNHAPQQPPLPQQQRNYYPNKQSVYLARRKNTQPVSLETTTNMFDVLKYLSDTQKSELLKQFDFYFSCTTWLLQLFSTELWNRVTYERSVLLHFRTILKHLVGNIAQDPPNESQPGSSGSSAHTSTRIDAPPPVQIVERQNPKIQVDASKSNEGETTRAERNCASSEEGRSIITLLSQVVEENIKMADSRSKDVSISALASHNEVLPKNNKSAEEPEQLRGDNNPVVDLSLESAAALDSNIHQKGRSDKEHENPTDLPENIVVDNIPQVVENRASAAQNLKVLIPDTLQQPNLQLVTVEISSKSEQVTVVDSDVVKENITIKNCTKSEQEEKGKIDGVDELPALEKTIFEESFLALTNNSGDFDHLNHTGVDISSQIADVRTISLETFEMMEGNSNVHVNSTEERIEEEEIKICLYCGKLSTVACAICLEAKYCSKTCSELHWEDHYMDCTPVQSVYS